MMASNRQHLIITSQNLIIHHLLYHDILLMRTRFDNIDD